MKGLYLHEGVVVFMSTSFTKVSFQLTMKFHNRTSLAVYMKFVYYISIKHYF